MLSPSVLQRVISEILISQVHELIVGAATADVAGPT
jgi:hypothetical protein